MHQISEMRGLPVDLCIALWVIVAILNLIRSYFSYVHVLRFVSRLLNQDWIGLDHEPAR